MHKQISLRNKITAFTVGSILLFGSVAIAIVFFYARSNYYALRQADIRTEVLEQASDIGASLEQAKRIVKHIASEKELIRYLEGDAESSDRARIVDMLSHYNGERLYDPLYVLDRSGIATASLDSTFVGNDYSFRSYFTNAMRGESTAEFLIGVTSGKAGYYVSSPVISSDGGIIGVVVGKDSRDIGNELISGSFLIENGSIMITDTDGIVLYASRADQLYHSIGVLSDEDRDRITGNRQFANLPLTSLGYNRIFQAIRTHTGTPDLFDFSNPVTHENEVVAVVAIPQTDLFLVVQESVVSLIAPVRIILFGLIIAVLLSMLATSIFVYVLVRQFLAPLSRLKFAAERISAGAFDYRVEIKTGDELGKMGEQFNVMADRLKNSYAGLERTVAEKTSELSAKLVSIEQKNAELRDTQRAVLNILEDARSLEAQIADERNHLRGILAAMGEGLFVLDDRYRIVLSNPIAERILDMQADEIIGKSMSDIITLYKGKEEVPVEGRPMVKVFTEGKIIAADLRDDFYWQTSKGRKFPVGFIAAPLTVGGIRNEVVVFRNLEKEKNLDEARTSFISITSHQLRTPLTSIKWFLEMLMEGSYADPLTVKQREFADLAYQASEKMVGIINLLLQIARVESGRLKVLPVPTDLKQLTASIIASFGNAFQMRKQVIIVQTVPDPLPVIQIDVDVMGQVIQNLLSNANRYANENSTIIISIEAGQGEQGSDFITYSIADQGIGIGKNATSRIFEKFYRAENALRSVPEGSGLGLSLVKSLVEGWGGRVWFESEEGKGTTFFFTIPIGGMQARAGEVGIAVT